jgi:lambda family phage tail tape measure protein
MADIASLGVSITSTDFLVLAANADAGTAAVDRFTASNSRMSGAASQAAQAQTNAASAQARATETTTASASAADRLIASLQRQVDIFGATDAALAAYNATAAKANEIQAQTIATSAALLSQLQAEAAQRAQYYAATEAATAAGARFIAGLRTQAETIGLSKTELLEYKAAQLGVADAAAPLIAQIEAQTAAMSKAATAAAALGESETAAAARISDAIAASLAQTDVLNDNTVATERYAASVDALAAAETKARDAQAVSAAPAAATGGRAAAGSAYADELNARTRAEAQASASGDEFSAATNKVSNSLDRQLLALTASKSQLVEYDAQMAGATEAETAYLVTLARGIELRQQEIAVAAEYAAAIEAEAAAANAGAFANTAFVREIGVIFRELSEGRITQAVASFTRLLSVANLLGLVFNPITIGLGLLGFAAIKGAEEFGALNTAIITTGNFSGESAGHLDAMAQSIAATGERSGVAEEALTKLAASGRFTAEQIALIGPAATAFSDATGTAVDKVVQEFVKLQEDPVKASAELNAQYHYLTLAVFEQIDALAKQGDAEGAVSLAEKARADSLKSQAEDIRASQGTIESGWNLVKDSASAAWDAMLGIGKPQTLEDQLSQVNKSLAAARGGQTSLQYALGSTETTPAPGGDVAALQAQQSRLQTAVGSDRNARDLQASYQQTQTAGIASTQALEALDKAHDKHSKLIDDLKAEAAWEDKVRTADPNSPLVTDAAVAARKAAIERADRERPTPGAAGLASAEREQPLQALKNQYDLQNALEQDQTKILDANYKARLVSADSYYKQEQILNDQDLANKLSYYTRLIALLTADMNASSTSAKQRVEDQTQIEKAQAESNVAIAEYAAKSTTISDQVVEANNKQTDAVKKYIQSLNDQIAKSDEADQKRLDAAGLGPRTRGQPAVPQTEAQFAQQTNAQGAQQILDIQARTATGTAGLAQAQIDQLVAAVQAADAKIIADHAAATKTLQSQDEQWTLGAEKAWDAWSAQSGNIAGQVNTAFTNLFNGLSDAVVKFAETGKFNFLSLAVSFSEAILKMEVQAAESQVFKLIQTGVLGALGAGAGEVAPGASPISATSGVTSTPLAFATGGYIAGPGSGTSDSINARLSNGEFVVNASATQANRGLLEAMNGGAQPSGKTAFATGGLVSSPNVSSGGTALTFNIDNSSTGGVGTGTQGGPTNSARSAALQKELESSVIEIIRRHSQPGGQVNKIIRSVNS